MSKRARYDGGYADGVFVEDQYQEGAPVYHVKQSGLLPQDASAKLRDELLAGEDWTDVQQATGSDTKGGGS